MTSNRILAAALLACALAAPALAAPPGAQHAAACVAALKAREAVMGEALRSGTPQPDLLDVVRSGIAIIGRQYLAGLGESEARALLGAAETEFDALPAAQAALRQRDCLREGHAFYEQASSLEKSLITSAAQRRIKRLKAA